MSPKSSLIVKCSAPGKVILHGEHSVVYGKLAIAASLDLRTTVTIEERNNSKLEIYFIDLKAKRSFNIYDLKQLFNTYESFPVLVDEQQQSKPAEELLIFLHPEILDHDAFIKKIKNALNLHEDVVNDKNKFASLISFLYLYFGIVHSAKIPIEALYISVKTELSIGSGTGSSASLMVSLAAAFLHYLTIKSPELKSKFEITQTDHFNEFQLNLISKWGFAAEKIIHQNPSGIDNTVCTYGSLVSFRKGRAPFAVKCKRDIKCLIVDTKIPKNTAEQIQKVVELKKRRPKVVEAIFDSIENITHEALDLLIQLGDTSVLNITEFTIDNWYKELGELATLNHNLLRTLGASHPALDKIVDIMAKKNLSGKLTGAGGGGYAIALIPSYVTAKDVTELCAELNKQSYQSVVTKLGAVGVRFEK